MNDLETMINLLTQRHAAKLAEIEKENTFLTFELIKTKEALKTEQGKNEENETETEKGAN